MRSIGNVDVDVVRAEYSKFPRKDVNVLDKVQSTIRKMISDIKLVSSTHQGLLSNAEDITVIESSLLDVKLPAESINYIITSPPYGVESLSYLRTHLLSYRCLQPILNYDPYTFNKKAIGSEYLQKNGTIKSGSLARNLSQTYNNFFDKSLSLVDSKKLQNRKDMMMGFFDDMVEVAQRFSLWLSLGGRLAFIIGNKKIADQTIPTQEITSEIFSSFGLKLDEVIKHKLKCNNSNSEVPWQERIIQDEYVMLFTKKE
jgi:tRNA G10  N-methylase Trm11